MMFLPLVTPFMWLVEEVVLHVVKVAVIMSFWFAILHRFGVIQRMVHRLVEVELSKLLNGCRITMSRIEFDIITGNFVVYDGIIHSPSRDIWKWDSPLLARFGRVTGKIGLISIIDPLSIFAGYTWREIHFVICDDIQVFVEKRRNVFNFHLLDESLDIPDPAPILNSLNQLHTINFGAGTRDKSGNPQSYQTPIKSDSTMAESPTISTEPLLSFDNSEGVMAAAADPFQGDTEVDQKANEIVSSVFKTVSQLGKAANKGGQDELQKVFKSQRDGIVTKLREFQESQQAVHGNSSSVPQLTSSSMITSNIGSPSQEGGLKSLRSSLSVSASVATTRKSSSMEMFAKESLKVVKSMGKAVERNVTEIQQSLKPPEKKKDYVRPKEDLLRIGFLVFRDIRIFTKDVILSSGGTGASPSPALSLRAGLVGAPDKQAYCGNIAKWSKPILLKEVTFEGKELCNPSSVRDENGLPIVGVDPDRIVDLLVRRALSEMAKTNTGRVFNNAMSEVFAWMDSVGGGNATTDTPAP